MKLWEIKSSITHILGLEIDPDVLDVSFPLPIENPTGKENVYVSCKLPDGLPMVGEIRYEYYRPHYQLEYVALDVPYDDEEQTLEEVIIPCLERHFGLTDLNECYQDKTKIKQILSPYSPVMRKSISIDHYSLTLSADVVFIPKQVDLKYIISDIVSVEELKDGQYRVIEVSERTKDENHLPLWKQIKQRLDEVLKTLSES